VNDLVSISASTAASRVTSRDLRRLLGLCHDHAAAGTASPRLRACADEARDWYAAHARPFMAWRRVAIRAIADHAVTMATGEVLESRRLATQLRANAAGELAVLAVSAGEEVVAEIARRWRDDRPDQAYCLDRFAAAVAERLLLDAAQLSGVASAGSREQWLPHLSPGCSDWGLVGQQVLMVLLTRDRAAAALGPVQLLESGALWPPHSMLAVRGITRGLPQQRWAPACRACDFDPCYFRRCPSAVEPQLGTVPP
jgi:hypothetical protein